MKMGKNTTYSKCTCETAPYIVKVVDIKQDK